ncbi:MAG: peptide-methionine (S)-S-oxide reductase MsrA [Clostridia bacterium]|nr:peptide-methionine (S)-S-oxide reductase MsrA [Clostridia bacterium]
MKTLYLAGGCFWGTQRFFDQFDGVTHTEVGYANGPAGSVTYEEVCKSSGHAETVRVDYDESVLSTAKLLEYYFMVIDPLSVNKQGGDEGVQYRTGVYYDDPSLLPDIEAAFKKEQAKYEKPMAVELLPLESFCGAEEYHQKYLVKNPTGYCHIAPWLLDLKK